MKDFLKNSIITCMLLFTGCFAMENEDNKTAKVALQELKLGSPFVDFSLFLSEEEKSQLNKFNVNGYKDFNNFANLAEFTSDATSFFEAIGNDSELSQSTAKIINNIVNNILLDFGQETAWVTIRAFPKTDAFEIPRWHVDGYYYQQEGLQYKVAITLKGSGTLFCNIPKEERKNFTEAVFQEYSHSLKGREELAKLLNQYKVYESGLYKGAAFVVGDPHNSAVHSEPQINSERIFVSILPGTKEQIKELQDRWNKGTPPKK